MLMEPGAKTNVGGTFGTFDPASRRLALAARPLQKHFACSNSRQLTNSVPGVCFGVIVSEYEFLSRHSTPQSSNSTVEPLNNVRMTRSHWGGCGYALAVC